MTQRILVPATAFFSVTAILTVMINAVPKMLG